MGTDDAIGDEPAETSRQGLTQRDGFGLVERGRMVEIGIRANQIRHQGRREDENLSG